MKYFFTTAELNKIAHVKGTLLKESGRINLVSRDASIIEENLTCYTVWSPEDNFHFINTPIYSEALAVYNKYNEVGLRQVRGINEQ